MSALSILVPFRSSDPHRIAVWDFLRPKYEALPNVELCIASDGANDGESFSFSRAVNAARRKATSDRLMVVGADQYPPTLNDLQRIHEMLDERSWGMAYRYRLSYDRNQTERILSGEGVDEPARGDWSGICWGVIALHSRVWDTIRGFDERMVGWGHEDLTVQFVLQQLYPDGYGDGDGVQHALWHEPAVRAGDDANLALFYEHKRAAQEGRLLEYIEARG